MGKLDCLSRQQFGCQPLDSNRVHVGFHLDSRRIPRLISVDCSVLDADDETALKTVIFN